jgi:AmpD protein
MRSPNFGARPPSACIDLVVLHSISLPPGVYGTDNVQALFTNRLDWNAHPYFKQIEGLQVSAHFYIQRGGEVWQFVSCDERAWHAGVSTYRGRCNCNDDSIGIELEGLEGDAFEAAQYEALAALVPALIQRYRLRTLPGMNTLRPDAKPIPAPA